jgi:MFS transporter, CP family, cyanate transporter
VVRPIKVVSPATRAAAVVIGVGVVAGFHVGVLPALLPELRETHGMSLFAAGLLVSMFQLAMGLLGVAAGALADRLGRARLPFIGLSLMLIADLVCAFASQASGLFLGRMLGSVAFLCMLVPGPALLLRIVTPANQRLLLGVYAAYMPVGMGVGLLASAAWLQHGTAQWLWLACGGLCFALALLYRQWVVAYLFVHAPDNPTLPLPASSAGLREDIRRTVLHGKPVLLALGFCFYAAQWMTVMNFLPSFYRSEGIGLQLAGSLTAIAVMVNALGTIGAGWLLQKSVSRGTLVCAASVVMLLAAGAVFSWSSGPWSLRYLSLLAFSIVGGLIPGTLFASTGAYAPDVRSIPTTTGLMQQGSALGQMFAAPAMGALVGYTGSWTYAWALSGSMALIVAWVGLRMLRTDRS